MRPSAATAALPGGVNLPPPALPGSGPQPKVEVPACWTDGARIASLVLELWAANPGEAETVRAFAQSKLDKIRGVK
jgi:hypothetical protein